MQSETQELIPPARVELRPVTILNYRVCHAQKRWGGVFVHDYFGEGLITKKKSGRRGINGSLWDGDEVDVTQFEASITHADYEAWEALADNDPNI